jgi:ABC-2 type transport system ATP-binding protein
MTDFIIETNQLCKSFKDKQALRGLDLQVPAGSIFGFLGRNGAGKTTTIKTLMGLLRSDSGVAHVFGIPVADADRSVEIRRHIGFVTEDKELYPYMTVEQIIRFTRPFFPKWRDDLAQRYLEMFELPPTQKIPSLSKGMRSKLMLLLAICRGADLLILDEPTDGLDPAATEDVLRELVDIAALSETTMFFSSHQLAEVDRIADHIGIIDHGKMIVTGSLDDLKAQYQRVQLVFANSDSHSDVKAHPIALPERWVEGVESLHQDGRVVSLLASHNVEAIVAQAQSIPGAIVERFPVTLKEIFLEHTRSN